MLSFPRARAGRQLKGDVVLTAESRGLHHEFNDVHEGMESFGGKRLFIELKQQPLETESKCKTFLPVFSSYSLP